jgi:hypothetical protein
MELASIIYSHSSYFDVLDLCLKEFPGDTLVAADEEFPDIETLIYKNESSYTERLIDVLEKVNFEWILYSHDDHILYEDPDWGVLEDLIAEDIDFIRLCRTGHLNLGEKRGNLHKIEGSSQDFFAVQPTIWNRKRFISFLKAAGPNSIWDLEMQGSRFSEGFNGFLYFEGDERKRGGHYDSKIFPCILTAVCKGKWNFAEYGEELQKIFDRHNFKTERKKC